MTEAKLHEHGHSGLLRDAIMLAIPPSLLGRLAAASIVVALCIHNLNRQPWRGGKIGC
jgi:hypothetical protein